jgi:hypothetical protein
LNYLFLGHAAPPCLESGDTNNDRRINVTDPIAIFGFLFLGDAVPAAPGPPQMPCGFDPDASEPGSFLGCAFYNKC